MQQHQLTVSQAAELYGVARSTVHRKLKSGRMSSTVRGDGKRVVALSELIRVMGEPHQVEEAVQQDAPPAEVFNDMLEELKALRSEVAELKAHMMRLPAPETPAAAPQATPVPTSTDDKPVNLFAAELAALRRKQGTGETQ
ncbi:helix-turn-helix domain-containing protein [Cobetia sp. 1CM21F]|uniref:helix-turn-helix domain-containing protein n=1 Tax=Cobetia sp. 1CM21F TaxID=2929163 RepID=UPI0020C01C58|nr:helix-turn-helix domain-containing protein [Cobetia sp. 1CM21F]MCK8069804.1 entry exclusion protein 1 [Cobetia sp. 1CM21F]